MQKFVVVVDADDKPRRALRAILEERNYPTTDMHSLPELKNYIEDIPGGIIVMDIDTIPVDNLTIRDMAIKNPGFYFLCLSKDRFHPDLKDAICYHIYACINKPLDSEELFYWLKTISEDEEFYKVYRVDRSPDISA